MSDDTRELTSVMGPEALFVNLVIVLTNVLHTFKNTILDFED